ncbi:rhodanese-like domain-containing protein [Lentibacter algarum]|uniref:rhodanese-like domain-containing protein n=1 Tax=Lentibacter algarum TaxID=576131 RepID=UPI001C073AFD|nr:rhodanese-like domain-containing protein [Lentibacter algarum]MBU2981544.1 rhodanese-like domain-containing protein [Lentibacter algarum]
MRLMGLLCASLAFFASFASAQDVRLTPEVASRSITLGNGQELVIERIQDTSHRLDNEFTKTSRPCPPFCISRISAAPGVETVGELEVVDFLEGSVAGGTGLLIDSRMPEWFVKGTIPGSVNVPFAALEANNPYRSEILKALGASDASGTWDFSEAKELLLFCNGPWCDQAPRAVRSLVGAGYPTGKIKFYRGGMQVWMLLGLTVSQPS